MISSTPMVFVLLLLSVLVAGQDKFPSLSSNNDQPKSKDVPHDTPSANVIEIHHSLHPPLDQSQVYWNFGGSTVLTRHAIRLTPASQNRRGWLWNDYPIESPNFEAEFHIEVASRPHFGGDGFGFWLLDSLQDPTYHTDPTFLSGDVFGLKKDFKGVGVVFDIYDNDGRRDNPSVFVLYNPEGVSTNYNHDNDYQDDMYKVVAPGQNPAYTCTASVRNLNHPVKVLVKYVRQVLHVYLDTEDGLGYKFCLAVKFDKPNAFKDHHIAFTAHTGQVADQHDLTQLTTRYLSEKEQTDDDHMTHMELTPHCSTRAFAYWLLIVGATFGLIATFAHLLITFRQLEAADINAVLVCEKMNKPLLPHLGVYFGVCALLLIGFQWDLLLLNSPLLLWRVYQFVRGQHLLTPAMLGGEKVHSQKGLSFSTKLILGIVVYSITFVFSFYRWYSC